MPSRGRSGSCVSMNKSVRAERVCICVCICVHCECERVCVCACVLCGKHQAKWNARCYDQTGLATNNTHDGHLFSQVC